MTKVAWFYFKEDSILNNGIIRWLNNAILVLLLLLPFLNQAFKGIFLSYNNLFSVIILSPIIMAICIRMLLKKTKFYEWDYKERKKKENFIIYYCGICAVLSSCLMLSLCILINILHKEDFLIIELCLVAIAPIIFCFNIINIPSLFYSLLKDDLQTDKLHILEEMPDNWGKAKIDDITEEMMSRNNGRD